MKTTRLTTLFLLFVALRFPITMGRPEQRQKIVVTGGAGGMLECMAGECEFNVKRAKICSDPCHTHTHEHMYDFSLEDVADVSNPEYKPNQARGDSCFYYKNAENINTKPMLPDNLVLLDDGCNAQCTGCNFYPLEIIEGPGFLQCKEGICIKYEESEGNDKSPSCFTDLEEASEIYGSMHTVLDGSDVAYSIYGYEQINTQQRIKIDGKCKLDCFGCDLYLRRTGERKRKYRKQNNGNLRR